MEISPYTQFLMLATAFLSGLFLGALWDMGTALRIVLGIYTPPERMRARYRRPLPLLGRGVSFSREGRWHRLWRGVILGVLDFCFCLLLAGVTEWVLYRFNSGVFRAGVPLLLLAGLGLWRISVARVIGWIIGWLAYGVSAALLYLRALLLLPPRLLRRLFLRFVRRPLEAMYRRHRAAKARRVSEALCRAQLAVAADGFEDIGQGGAVPPIAEENTKKGRVKTHHGKKTKRETLPHASVDHTHTHHRHFLPFRGHHRQSSGGVEQKERGKGTA